MAWGCFTALTLPAAEECYCPSLLHYSREAVYVECNML
jgi:hypothetical protein